MSSRMLGLIDTITPSLQAALTVQLKTVLVAQPYWWSPLDTPGLAVYPDQERPSGAFRTTGSYDDSLFVKATYWEDARAEIQAAKRNEDAFRNLWELDEQVQAWANANQRLGDAWRFDYVGTDPPRLSDMQMMPGIRAITWNFEGHVPSLYT